MDIDTCIEEYLKMAPYIFPIENLISGSKFGKLFTVARGQQRFDPKPLEDAVKGLVVEDLGERAMQRWIHRCGLKPPETKAQNAKCMAMLCKA